MRKLLLGAGLIAGSIFMVGCTTTTDLVNTAYIIKANESVTKTVLKANLSAEDIQTVLEAEKAMKDLVDLAESIKHNPSQILLIDSYIEEAVSKYEDAREISLTHRSDYALYDWEGLESFHLQMSEAYSTYLEYRSDRDYSAALGELGDYAKLGMKVAIIFGG